WTDAEKGEQILYAQPAAVVVDVVPGVCPGQAPGTAPAPAAAGEDRDSSDDGGIHLQDVREAVHAGRPGADPRGVSRSRVVYERGDVPQDGRRLHRAHPPEHEVRRDGRHRGLPPG